MIDPLISLAFSVHSNPNVYALLLGSGISREAQVPTGWEITLDLIRNLANLNTENCEPNPELWYSDKYGEEPNYSKILGYLSHSSAERANLLRKYFEPNDKDREEGKKQPTITHRTIANLVDQGFIRIIVTTNFDRLLEQALDEIGIAPYVISSPDAAKGALPLAHSKCTIIKVHGDYLDTRIKNTPKELSTYSREINKILDQVFEEYGLIICGWSSDWDTALVKAIERCKSRRFTTWWAAHKGNISTNAQRIINSRMAQVIEIDTSDSFFSKLYESVCSLVEYDRPHPLSVKMAVASLKKYIVDERYDISLHDLISGETTRVEKKISVEHFPIKTLDEDKEIIHRVNLYDGILEVLRSMFALGCYWGNQRHEEFFIQTIQRIANANDAEHIYNNSLLFLKFYPALILLYSGGISCIARKNYIRLWFLISKPTITYSMKEVGLMDLLHCQQIMRIEIQKKLENVDGSLTPLSDHLYNILKPTFAEIIPSERDYDNIFNYFEYMYSLLTIDHQNKGGRLDEVWAPSGRFLHRSFGRLGGQFKDSIIHKFNNEIFQQQNNWDMLKAGAFNGSFKRYIDVMNAAHKIFKETAKR